ncbi:hypothetical protein M406DRAFT_332664 [Cryphonectria parasitica EP155]|uniref:Uncharacterized protein n=1 Tax=Cryphonectria parasitica (strain ATCC 38755 / EP155) TaxID=660469 RepID=A0A9P4XWV8_CRYP1|nr:uncharacterized protein M406DRAFT_332664 [Cryphonectria parasitica EP155]KAF3762282.1 hypothetical protein M406DRAFT_332664 [Cryphonectria parasitica EP155]
MNEKHSSDDTANHGSMELHDRAAGIKPQMRRLHDPAVTFEEYMFYAERARLEEDAGALHNTPGVTFKSIFLPSANNKRSIGAGADGAWSAATELNLSDPKVRAAISDQEWANASRALRTASAAACFYLITTDILGPFGVGFALGTMGWGEGFGFYTLFGIMTGFSGYLLWKVFMNRASFDEEDEFMEMS